MISITKDTIIGDILDVGTPDCTHFPVHWYALSGLPIFPRRDC